MSRRINPDSIQALWFTVGLVAFLVATSFMVSFAGLTEVAAWVGLPGWMGWTIPAFIDVAILAYALAVLIHRSRGEATWPSWLSLGLFTAVSVAANAAHALSIDHEIVWQAVVGAGLAALAPVGVFAATEELGRLVVEQPNTKVAADVVEERSEVLEQVVEVQPVLEAKTPPMAEELPERALPVESDDSAEDQFALTGEDPDDEDPLPPKGARVGVEEKVQVESTSQIVDHAPEQKSSAHPSRVLSLVEVKPEKNSKPSNEKELDELGVWVADELAKGQQPTAKGIASLLGVSERTGRRKLAALREHRPQIFDAEERRKA